MARDTQVDSSLSLWNSLTELMKIDCENELARATVSVCEQIGVAPLAVLIRHSGDYVASGATGLERDSMFAMFGPTDVQISMDPAQIGEIFPRLEVPTLARALRGEQLEILGVVIVRGGLPRESLLAFGCICDLLTLRLREIERRVVDRLRIEALSEQLDKYHGFIAKVSEGIWRCDLPTPVPIDWDPERQVEYIFENGVMAECNETMAKMYGFDRSEEILGLALRQLLLPGEPQNRDYLKKFIKNGYRLNDSESIEQDRFGRPRYFVNNLVGVIEDAKLVGAWGTQRDVTAYKVLQEELTLAAQEAARANLAKSAFLANVSHELRTPLGIILGFADLALDGSDPTSEVHGFIEGIKRNGQLLAHILGEVLDLSKIEASRFEAESIRFALVPLLDEIVASMELNAHKKGLELRFERETPLPRFVRSDPMRLRQILNNLLSNAIKFTEKGAVVLSVRMLSPVRVGAPLEIGFSVKDSGIGISAEAAQRLFQPFSQADAATARKYGGTGLGLNLSRQLARMLGGDLLLKSSCEGNGSCFRLNLKVGEYDGELVYGGANEATEVTVATGASSLARANERLGGKRVLVVEDSEDNQTLLSHYLRAMGLDVDIAGDGLEGLAKAEKDIYDLVVMDIQMPGMDGHATAQALRAKGFSKPIIALTAHAFKEDRDKAMASGFNDYLTKPINRTLLMQALTKRLKMPSDLH